MELQIPVNGNDWTSEEFSLPVPVPRWYSTRVSYSAVTTGNWGDIRIRAIGANNTSDDIKVIPLSGGLKWTSLPTNSTRNQWLSCVESIKVLFLIDDSFKACPSVFENTYVKFNFCIDVDLHGTWYKVFE